MKDRYNRDISYARISVTDACNLRCVYCIPKGYVPVSKNDLSNDAIITITRALAALGIKKIRITGGEPLVRNDILPIISRINSIDGIQDIGITTNGTLLNKELIKELKKSGLKSINISLDSLKEGVFNSITDGSLGSVLEAIDDCIEEGIKVKINMVPIRGINDGEIIDFIHLTKDRDIDVRFIELMPIGQGAKYEGASQDYIIDIMKKLVGEGYYKLNQTSSNLGPSVVYSLKNHKGRVGIISPITHKFCSLCNRVRITSDGKLKPCLHSSEEIDLMPYVDSQEKIEEILKKGIFNKNLEHSLDVSGESKANRDMVRIGG